MIKTLAKELGVEKKEVKTLSSGMGLFGAYREGGIINPINSGVLLDEDNKKKLEEAYFSDPIIFKSINTIVQMIMSAGFRIEFNNLKEKEIFTEFLEGLGNVGEDCFFEEIYEYILWAEAVFGAAWVELVWDKNDERIIDLNRLDPKSMDYARDSNKEVVLDDLQKPVGYIQKLPKGNPFGKRELKNLGDPVPEKYKKKISLGDDKIFLLPERIAMIKLFTGGDNLRYIGLIEPAFDDVRRKAKIEGAGANSAYQRWMSPLIAYIGDERHPPTPALTEETLKRAREMKHDIVTGFPYYVRIDSLKGTEMAGYTDMVKLFRENIVASLHMPMPFATGSGEATNRATLNSQQAMLEFTLNHIAKKTALNVMKRIFKPVAKSYDLDTYPRIIPNVVKVDEMDDRAIRFSMYVDKGILSPEEVRPIVAEAEGVILNNQNSNQQSSGQEPKDNQKNKEEQSMSEFDEKYDYDRVYDKDSFKSREDEKWLAKK